MLGITKKYRLYKGLELISIDLFNYSEYIILLKLVEFDKSTRFILIPNRKNPRQNFQPLYIDTAI